MALKFWLGPKVEEQARLNWPTCFEAMAFGALRFDPLAKASNSRPFPGV